MNREQTLQPELLCDPVPNWSYAQTVKEKKDAHNILICCPKFRWPRETRFEPNRLIEEVLNSMILWLKLLSDYPMLEGTKAKFNLVLESFKANKPLVS